MALAKKLRGKKEKKIPIKELKTCHIQPWFKFREQCTIHTCKFYSERLPSHCMGIDAKIQNSNFSDAEILYYKFPDKNLTVRSIAQKRKQAQLRVRNLIVLHLYIEHIRAKCDKPESHFEYQQKRQVEKMLRRYPLKIKKLRFEVWMLPHLFDMHLFDEFTCLNVQDGLPTDLRTLLCMSKAKFSIVRNFIENPVIKKKRSK